MEQTEKKRTATTMTGYKYVQWTEDSKKKRMKDWMMYFCPAIYIYLLT